MTHEMYDTLKNMLESNNTLSSLTLKNQLQHINMTKADTIATFLMKISEIRDQLGAIGETISDKELVLTTLNALPRHWDPFLQSISGRAEIPNFDHLWTNSTQDEITLIARGVQDSPFHTKKGNERMNKRSFNKEFKDKKLHQHQVMNIEKKNQRFIVSDVTSMDTLREIVLPERKEDNLPPLLMLIQSHIRL
jgi:hypothetical protein